MVSILIRFANWLGFAIAPLIISIIFSFLSTLTLGSLAFFGISIMIEDMFSMIDVMLRGVIPLNSAKIVEAAGLFLSLKIYLYSLGARLTIVLSFFVYGWTKNIPEKYYVKNHI